MQLTKNYHWGRTHSGVSTPQENNTIHNLRQHNMHLKTRLRDLAEQLHRLELQSQSRVDPHRKKEPGLHFASHQSIEVGSHRLPLIH